MDDLQVTLRQSTLEELVEIFRQRFEEDAFCILEHVRSRIVKLDPDGDTIPRDKRCARVVSRGILEAICDYSARIGPDVVMSTTLDVLEHLSDTVFMSRTNKAIRERKQEIESSLRNLRLVFGVPHPVIEVIEGMLAKAKLVTDSTRKIALCAACGENLQEDQIKRCSRCGLAIYCSKGCQLIDWKELGHKKKCFKIDKTMSSRRISRCRENLQEAGRKIMAQNIHRFCAVSSLKGYSVLECVCIVDVGQFSTKLDVKTFDEFIHEMPPEKHDDTRSVLENNCSSELVSCCIQSVVDANSVHMIEGLPAMDDTGWAGMQRLSELRFPLDIATVRSDPERRNSLIKGLCTPGTHLLQN